MKAGKKVFYWAVTLGLGMAEKMDVLLVAALMETVTVDRRVAKQVPLMDTLLVAC
jgi:hypothetical protein